jgi:hypothetical protein
MQASGRDAEPYTPSQVIQRYYELAASGKVEEARKYRLTKWESEPDNSPPAGDIRVEVAELPILDESEKTIYETGVRFRELQSEVIDGNKAEVVALIMEPDKSLRPILHQLRRQDGKWRLQHDVYADSRFCMFEPAACHIILTPAAVVNWYYHYAASGKIEKAREYLAAPPASGQEVFWPDSFGPGAEKGFSRKGVKFGALQSETVEGDNAEVLALIMSDGKLAPVRHYLSRQGGSWKIQNYFKTAPAATTIIGAATSPPSAAPPAPRQK